MLHHVWHQAHAVTAVYISKEGTTLHRGSALHESCCSLSVCLSALHIFAAVLLTHFFQPVQKMVNMCQLVPWNTLFIHCGHQWPFLGAWLRQMLTSYLVFLFHHFQLQHDTNADFILGYFFFYLCVWQTAACLSLRVNISSAKVDKPSLIISASQVTPLACFIHREHI